MHRLQFTGTAPRNRVHPSIHPFIYPSIILLLSSKHPKVIITPLRSNKKRRSQSSIADHHSLPASSAFNRVIYSLLVDIPFFPVFVKGIYESIRSRYFCTTIFGYNQPISTTISTNRSENRSIFFLLKYTKKHVPSRPRPRLFKKQKCVL